MLNSNGTSLIHAVGSEAFLVSDDSLRDINAPFYSWLRENGFTFGGSKGHYDVVTWMHINITNKTYAYGMPGQAIITATGGHAITVEEFMTIYSVYAKYTNKGLFEFS